MIGRLVVICGLLLGASATALAQEPTPCRCEAGYTGSTSCAPGHYAPALYMFNRWKPAGQVTYHIAQQDADMDLPGPNGVGLNPATVRQDLQQAANTWNNAPCCCTEWAANGSCVTNPAPTVKPTIQLVHVTIPDAVPADGKEPGDNHCGAGGKANCDDVIKRIWVAKKSYAGTAIQFPDMQGVLAITLPFPDPPLDPYKIWRARIAFNGHQIRWFTGTTVPPTSQCNSSNKCYSLLKTATHEFGHFIGYRHSTCSSSVMTQYASENSVSLISLRETDVKSVCALVSNAETGSGYGTSAACPAAPSGMTGGGGTSSSVGRYQECDADSDCTSPLKCANVTGPRYCDLPCTSDADCTAGEHCPSTGAKYCFFGDPPPGVSGSTGGTSAGPTPDFCAPCEGHADCENGVCVELGEGQRICSSYCVSNAACGSGATCTSTSTGNEGVCVPDDLGCVQAAVERRGQLNEACDAENPCGPNLLCVQLAQAAVCLEYCDTDTQKSNAHTCSTDGYSCLELDKELKYGVCFKSTAREGESCLLPDTSLCGFTGTMICAGTPEKAFQDAACYKLCGGQYGSPCASDQQCVGSPVGACRPLPTNTCPLSDFGQKCAKAEDCAGGMCQIRGGEQACSRTCSVSLQSGCPQSFTCLAAGAGDKGFCWPSNNTIRPAPECADEQTGCGTCSGSGLPADGVMWSLLVAGVWLVRRQRKARPC